MENILERFSFLNVHSPKKNVFRRLFHSDRSLLCSGFGLLDVNGPGGLTGLKSLQLLSLSTHFVRCFWLFLLDPLAYFALIEFKPLDPEV